MFGGAAQGVTKIKSSLPAVQELPGHQKVSKVQVKPTKKPGCWSKFGKFKVDTKKTQETSGTSGTNDLKKISNWKKGSSKCSRRILTC